MVEAGGELSLQAAVELLRQEMDASKHLADHLRFIRGIAAGQEIAPALRDELLAHIDDEEADHRANLARLVPALEALVRRLEGTAAAPAAPGLTVGSLIARRPEHVRPQR